MEEAQAIRQVFTGRAEAVPVAAAKSYFGNLGAAGGLVELAASLLAMQDGRLFRTLNYETPDPECRVNVAVASDVSPGEAFANINVTPQGQAAVVLVRTV
jgi:3-oxoacyl-[acyl-carrier-protein] synthase II